VGAVGVSLPIFISFMQPVQHKLDTSKIAVIILKYFIVLI
jgi:hypothetical protein